MNFAGSFVVLLILSYAHPSVQRVSFRIENTASKRLGGTVLSEVKDTFNQAAKEDAAKMHIVIAHYSVDNLQQTLDTWTKILNLDKIKALEPSVYIYCQNPLIVDLSILEPLQVWGGETRHVENLGRESHAFLLHILHYYHEMPEVVLFSQDIPDEGLMEKRIEKLLVPETGFLPLALVAPEPCFTDFLPGGLVAQLFAWHRKAFCPPEGISISFMGQFIVSRDRLRRVEYSTYQNLLDLLIAPSSHWVHGLSEQAHLKSPKNPMMGHVLERTWAVAFDCWERYKVSECNACDSTDNMVCDKSACQCLDAVPVSGQRRRASVTEYEARKLKDMEPSPKA